MGQENSPKVAQPPKLLDRVRASLVGGGVADVAELPGGEVVDVAAGEEARQEEGARDGQQRERG